MIDRFLLQTIQTPCHPCVTPVKAVVSLSNHRLRGNDKRYLLHLINHGGDAELDMEAMKRVIRSCGGWIEMRSRGL